MTAIAHRTSPTFRALLGLRTAAAEIQSTAYNAPGATPVQVRTLRRLGQRVQRSLPVIARSGIDPMMVSAVAHASRAAANLGSYRTPFGTASWYMSEAPSWAAAFSVAADQIAARRG